MYAWHQGNAAQGAELQAVRAVGGERQEDRGHTARWPGYTLEKRGETWFLTVTDRRRARTRPRCSACSTCCPPRARRSSRQPISSASTWIRPRSKVNFDGQTFSFGTTNPLTQDQYLAHRRQRLSGFDLLRIAWFPARADRVLTHSLFNQERKAGRLQVQGFQRRAEGRQVDAVPRDRRRRRSGQARMTSTAGPTTGTSPPAWSRSHGAASRRRRRWRSSSPTARASPSSWCARSRS